MKVIKVKLECLEVLNEDALSDGNVDLLFGMEIFYDDPKWV